MRDKPKVIAKKVVTLKGIKIEVRLLDVPTSQLFRDGEKLVWKTTKWRILPRARYYPKPSRQQDIRKILKRRQK